MNNKGFTLPELIIVFLIIGILTGTAITAYSSIFGVSEEKYYSLLKSNILLAGSDYFNNHRGDILGTTLTVSIERLVSDGYIEEIKDAQGNVCHDGTVIKYLGEDHQYHYDVCLKCGDFVNNNEYCE